MPPERTMEQTVQLIEKGLEDIKNNKATKAEVLELIAERKQLDDAAIKAAQDTAQKAVSELDAMKTVADELQSKMRQLRAGRYDAIKGPDGSYRGAFSCPAEAKMFGLMVMAAATAGKADLTEKHKAYAKGVEDLGGSMSWLNEKGLKTMTGASQTGGSALVTPDYIPSLIRLFETYGVFERNAQIVPLGSSGGLQPKTDKLLTLYCPGEGGTITADDPAIDLISHQLRTICAITAYSLELDEDSALELGEVLGDLFARSYGYGIDRIGFLGDGTSAYFGMMGIVGALRKVDATIGNIKSLVVGTGNEYSELKLGDFMKLIGNLPDYADDSSAKMYMHRYFYFTVYVAQALAAGGSPASEVILGAGQRQKQALSYPVEFTQVMPRTQANSQICTIFGNLRMGAQMGRRGILEIAQSTERYFEKGLVAVRARRRISTNIFGVGDTTKPGPITGLITAAS